MPMNVLVITCNERAHLLSAFAHCFNSRWPAIQAVDVFGYEDLPRDLPTNFLVHSLGRQKDVSWAAGLRKALGDYPDEFVLLLEDYFLVRPVNLVQLTALWNYALEGSTVAKLDLTGDRMKVPHQRYAMVAGIDIVSSFPDAPYQASLQAAIWKRWFLWSLLTEDEDPWQFEKHATNRIIQRRREIGSSFVVLGTYAPVLNYANAAAGRGGVLRYNVPDDLKAELKREGVWAT